MHRFREITDKDNVTIAKIIRDNLKAVGLDIPGTAYFDAGLGYKMVSFIEEKMRTPECP